nr:hypothetical transcript [Hymenolepis microstoma]
MKVSLFEIGRRAKCSRLCNRVFMANVSSDLIPTSVTGQITVAPNICDTASEPTPSSGLYPSPQLSLHTLSTTATKTSFTSIPAVYEIEDMDSSTRSKFRF